MKLLFASFFFGLALWAGPHGDTALAQTVVHEDVPRRAEPGQRRQIWIMWDLDEACETHRGFTVQIDRQPRAGVLELAKTEQTVTMGWINPRVPPHFRMRVRQCAGRSVPVIAVFYTARGAPGTIDTAAISTTNPRTQFTRRIRFQILVE